MSSVSSPAFDRCRSAAATRAPLPHIASTRLTQPFTTSALPSRASSSQASTSTPRNILTPGLAPTPANRNLQQRQQRCSTVIAHGLFATFGKKEEEPKPQPQTPAKGISLLTVGSTLQAAGAAWDKADKEKKGLTLAEATELLNSPELKAAALSLTNVEPLHRTEADVEPLFKRADEDKSGRLSRTEFLAMYLAVITQRVKANPLVLAEGLLGFIDVNRDGKISGGELRVLLTMLGFPIAMLLPIPDSVGIDYRAIIKGLSGNK